MAHKAKLPERELLLSPAVSQDPRPPRDSARDAMQPGAQRVRLADRVGLERQDQEGRLKGVLGRVLIPQHAAADPQHHRAMPMDDASKACCAATLSWVLNRPNSS